MCRSPWSEDSGRAPLGQRLGPIGQDRDDSDEFEVCIFI